MTDSNLESKTEDDNLVKLPFESELGNPIYVPEDSGALELFNDLQNVKMEIFMAFWIEYIQESLDKALPKSYSAKSITEFSKVLTKDMMVHLIGKDYSGIVLNHLIQKSADPDHEIHIEQADLNLVYFGFHNVKSIDVFGDLQRTVGGFQYCGVLNVHGNVGDYAASDMSGGTIWIKGNSGENLGYDMNGGQVLVEGDIKSVSNQMSGGDIYHKGKQIVKDGSLLDESYSLERTGRRK